MSNRVYNELRTHSMRVAAHHDERDHSRAHGKEDFATSERALDQRTRLIVRSRRGAPRGAGGGGREGAANTTLGRFGRAAHTGEAVGCLG